MTAYEVIVSYPYYYDMNDEYNRWTDWDVKIEIVAETQDAANAAVEARIRAGEFDAKLIIPPVGGIGGDNTDLTISPHISTAEQIAKRKKAHWNALYD